METEAGVEVEVGVSFDASCAIMKEHRWVPLMFVLFFQVGPDFQGLGLAQGNLG